MEVAAGTKSVDVSVDDFVHRVLFKSIVGQDMVS